MGFPLHDLFSHVLYGNVQRRVTPFNTLVHYSSELKTPVSVTGQLRVPYKTLSLFTAVVSKSLRMGLLFHLTTIRKVFYLT